jgi:hypothetical protein
MKLLVHHRPADLSQLWSMRVWQSAWDENYQRDHTGTATLGQINFEVDDAPELRRIQFKFHSSDRVEQANLLSSDINGHRRPDNGDRAQ